MRKLFLGIGIFVSVSVSGQYVQKTGVDVGKQKGHKATGDKPSFSKEYAGYGGNDSILYITTTYTYNANKQVVKRIGTYEGGDVDSVVTTYDAQNRIILEEGFYNDEQYISRTWVYDEQKKQIDYYEKEDEDKDEILDSVRHIVYKGVRNFNEIDEDISLSLSIMGSEIEYRVCDTILVYSYDEDRLLWNLEAKIVSKINSNGKVTSITSDIDKETIKMLEEFASEMLGSPVKISNVALQLTPTYRPGDAKLTKISGVLNITADIAPLPISFSFITLENQYNDAALLKERLIEMKVGSIMGIPVDQYLVGMMQKYSYNSENNLVCMASENSADGDTWDIDSKTYYFYDNVSIKNIHSANMNLNQTIPNPANDRVLITYSVPTAGNVQFTVYSVNGQALIVQSQEAKIGENTVELSVSDLASGLYFYSMECNGQQIVRKMSVQR